MKLLHKLIILAAVVLPVGASAGIAAYQTKKASNVVPSDTYFDEDYVVMENANFKFKLDTYNLSFTIKKGEKEWNSGVIDPSDTETTSLRKALLTNAVSINAYNSDGGEASFSIFDTSHKATTTVTVTPKSNKVVAKVSVVVALWLVSKIEKLASPPSEL